MECGNDLIRSHLLPKAAVSITSLLRQPSVIRKFCRHISYGVRFSTYIEY